MKVSSVAWKSAQDRAESVAWVDVRDFDALWHHSGDYVGHKGAGSTAPEKYAEAGAFIQTHSSLFFPRITMRDDVPEFADGRHTTAWLRDHGSESIPMICDQDTLQKLMRLCPAKRYETFYQS